MAFGLTGVAAPDAKPSCSNCPATYVSSTEIQTYLKRAIAAGAPVSDQQIREVDIGKANVAVGLVYRPKLAAPADKSVAEHDLVSEVYHIIDGSGTLVTGPEMVDQVRRPADNENVRLMNGPGNNASSIRHGVTHELKAGDVVFIPAGTGHQFTRIDDHLTYLMVRVDPDKVTPVKDEAASKADLAHKGQAR
jgi:mannose-6-phosphate isomerase-like protein (cupin superfamily)